jgi:hypothetical protein
VRRGNVRAGVVLTVTVVAVSSCGSPAPTYTASPKSSSTTASRPSAAAGPCASVTTTTAIGQVPAACAAAWAPYGVTKVPPANLTDSTPVPPSVVNGSHGAVTDSDAQSWALAENRGSIWYRWAEASIQASLLPHLGVLGFDPAAELQALAAGEAITQPDCSIFPTRIALFAIGPADMQFFASRGETVSSAFVFVATFPGPCAVRATSPDGHVRTIASYATSVVTFFAGQIRRDAVLGDIWYVDGAGNCGDHGAPIAWCT